MDHSSMGNSTVCKMNMSFHWGACEFFLVRSWQANTIGKFVGATIGIFLMAILYEGLKYYREVLFVQSQQMRNRPTITKNANGSVAHVTTVKLSITEQMFNVPHVVQSVLHFIQVFVSYILMLLVMFMNWWWFLAVCFGAALGYFFFGWLRKQAFKDINDCCQ